MHRARNAIEERLAGIIEANYFDAIPDITIGPCKLTEGLRRAASNRRETTDDVKYMQK
jgi:hypothetical protein